MRIIRPAGEVLMEISENPDTITIRELKADLVDVTGAPAKSLTVNLRDFFPIIVMTLIPPA